MSAGTTSIDDLPTKDEANITLETSSVPVQQTGERAMDSGAPQPNIQLSTSDISKIVEGIQMASANNMTALPSRDIPQNQSTITNDPQVQPNHVPEKKGGFVEEFDNTHARLYQEQMQQQKNAEQLDSFYDKLQTPIMISIIFFIFQLPFLNKFLYRYLPSLFLKEKQLSIGGYVGKTILFGAAFMFVQHVINALNAI